MYDRLPFVDEKGVIKIHIPICLYIRNEMWGALSKKSAYLWGRG